MRRAAAWRSPPTRSRPALKALPRLLCDAIREQEAAWARRDGSRQFLTIFDTSTSDR
jgi:hypothetical protein